MSNTDFKAIFENIMAEHTASAEVAAKERHDQMEAARLPDETPYDELDSNLVKLVRTLNSFPGVQTNGSCGGHEPPIDPGQWEVGSWFVKLRFAHDEWGWGALYYFTWALNQSLHQQADKMVMLIPTAYSMDLPTADGLYFAVEGWDGVNPDEVADHLDEFRWLYPAPPDANGV